MDDHLLENGSIPTYIHIYTWAIEQNAGHEYIKKYIEKARECFGDRQEIRKCARHVGFEVKWLEMGQSGQGIVPISRKRFSTKALNVMLNGIYLPFNYLFQKLSS